MLGVGREAAGHRGGGGGGGGGGEGRRMPGTAGGWAGWANEGTHLSLNRTAAQPAMRAEAEKRGRQNERLARASPYGPAGPCSGWGGLRVIEGGGKAGRQRGYVPPSAFIEGG